MAFMMPVMKNQYNIYPSRSRKSSTSSNGTRSRTVSETAKSDVLSTSPQSTASEPPASRRFIAPSRYSRSGSQDSNGSVNESSSSSDTGLPSSPTKIGSRTSLQKFHTKLVDKMKRKFKRKSSTDDEDGAMEDDPDKGVRSSS
uniref:Uncharacterized protein n=1 Tax=Strigamia maritima TaxID=126957 RepID=T1IXH9_STRMM